MGAFRAFRLSDFGLDLVSARRIVLDRQSSAGRPLQCYRLDWLRFRSK